MSEGAFVEVACPKCNTMYDPKTGARGWTKFAGAHHIWDTTGRLCAIDENPPLITHYYTTTELIDFILASQYWLFFGTPFSDAKFNKAKYDIMKGELLAELRDRLATE